MHALSMLCDRIRAGQQFGVRRRVSSVIRSGLALNVLFSSLAPAIAQETISYSFDARGRLIKVDHGSSGPNSCAVASYAYDAADNRSNVTVVKGVTLTLLAGQSMWSADGRFQLAMQTDGNLVLYGPNGATWWTSTFGGADRRMVMQCDGNLVVYNAANQGLWASNTGGNLGSHLALQNDGNLVIYNAANAGIWSTNTVFHLCGGVSFAVASNGAVTEGASSGFTVTKSGSTSGSCSVNYATADGTAAAGSDYSSGSGTLTFTAGQSSQAVSIATIDDASIESAETFALNLSGPSDGGSLSTGTATATIYDNDTPPCSGVSFAVASNGAVTEGGTSSFTVTKSGSTGSSCSVNYATSDGSAGAGSDYTATSGTLNFGAAETTKTVSVATIDDTAVESAETLNLNLSGPTGGATVSTAQAAGTINDNDVPPTPSFSVNDASGVEGTGATITFTVTRTGSTSGSYSVNYATADGTANSVADYFATSGTLTFSAGQSVKTVTVTLRNNAKYEPDELFYLNLSGATGGATISDSQGVATVFDDDPPPCQLGDC